MDEKTLRDLNSSDQISNRLLERVRSEFTVMPRFGFHQPIDRSLVTLPPEFPAPEIDPLSGLAIPPPQFRFGYSPQDTDHYLNWGRFDHDELIGIIHDNGLSKSGLSLLDFGCSSGRVLRHFQSEHAASQWKLHGCDIQALAIQWMREFFPDNFEVANTSTLPHLPYEDNSFDFIYGFSVFTHVKFQWDAWLLELRRVLKPGGVMVQTIHTENAWKYYADHKEENWIRSAHCSRVYDTPEMDVDFLYHGDISVSQVFWKKQVAQKYWARYFDVLEITNPPRYSFQDWIICRKRVQKQ